MTGPQLGCLDVVRHRQERCDHADQGSLMAVQDPDMATDNDPATLLQEFKRLADAQLELAKEFGAEARQAFLYVAGFFTIAQTAALTTFQQDLVGDTERHVLLVAAIIAGVGVAATGIIAALAEIRTRYDAVGEKDVEKAEATAERQELPLDLVLAKRYQKQVQNGETVIRSKRRWTRAAQVIGAVTIGVVGFELIVAMVARFS